MIHWILFYSTYRCNIIPKNLYCFFLKNLETKQCGHCISNIRAIVQYMWCDFKFLCQNAVPALSPCTLRCCGHAHVQTLAFLSSVYVVIFISMVWKSQKTLYRDEREPKTCALFSHHCTLKTKQKLLQGLGFSSEYTGICYIHILMVFILVR